LKEFDYSWDDQDPEQISDLVEGEYDASLDSIEKHGVANDADEGYDDSGLCSCGDGGKQSECEDCKHDFECGESQCSNGGHQRVESASSNSPEVLNEAAMQSSPSAPNTGRFTRQGKNGTQEEDKKLSASYNSSESYDEIATILGRTAAAIRARLVKICFEDRVSFPAFGYDSDQIGLGWTEEEDAQLQQLHEGELV
jgi:hypothetical protein